MQPRDEQFAATALYEAMVRYLVGHGWKREDACSGWWWRDGFAEAPIGEAVSEQLRADGIDSRVMLADEPREFWSEVDFA